MRSSGMDLKTTGYVHNESEQAKPQICYKNLHKLTGRF